MYSITEVDAGVYRSSEPTEGQLTQWSNNPGIGAAIDLENNSWQQSSEEDICSKLGLDSIQVPMGIFIPDKGAVLEVYDRLVDYIRRGIKVLVHCLHGVDRTGIVIAYFRIRYCGWSVKRALRSNSSFKGKRNSNTFHIQPTHFLYSAMAVLQK